MNVLELYSGIGGMHFAFKESGLPGAIALSVEINQTANKVYKHNFPSTNLQNRNVQSLTSDFLNGLDIDCVLMSPPCQPFTRNGLKNDVNDPRTDSFFHILQLLPALKHVKRVLIENVKGFETSEMCRLLKESLEECGFVYQEFILSPTQFGVPNMRHRYYCLGKRSPLRFNFATNKIMTNLPNCSKTPLHSLHEIIEENTNDYALSEVILNKRASVLDICYPNSRRSCCFTKAYGRYVTGTGSVYTDKTEEEVREAYENCRVKELGLRFFTPKEVGRLMCFPEEFEFPEGVSNRQKYALLGNSINVKVVSELIKLLYD